MSDIEQLVTGTSTPGTSGPRSAAPATVAEVWAADGRYVDPLVDASGRDPIAATIGAVQQQFPDFSFRLTGEPEAHHDVVRFRWELGPAGADAPIAGSDVAVVTADGRLRDVHGFLDRVPG